MKALSEIRQVRTTDFENLTYCFARELILILWPLLRSMYTLIVVNFLLEGMQAVALMCADRDKGPPHEDAVNVA